VVPGKEEDDGGQEEDDGSDGGDDGATPGGGDEMPECDWSEIDGEGVVRAERLLAGAAFKSDGLCPFWWLVEEEPAPLLTLQLTPASVVCNIMLEDALERAGERPTWFVELKLRFDAPGTYYLRDYPNSCHYMGQLDADGGGGGGGQQMMDGVIVLDEVGPTHVRGEIHGVCTINSNGWWYDINGPFEAVRCTEDEWLDYGGEPGEFLDDPDCLWP